METPPPERDVVVDEDADGSFLDEPEPRYRGRTGEQSAEAVDRRLADARERPLPKLPPPTWR